LTFQFGDFTADLDTRQLVRGGQTVHLSPKAFDLLVALIQSRPRALSKAELHAHVWPSTFVSDASLAMLVAEIRSALGESARESRFVRTVHRHGYAFSGSATEQVRTRHAQAEKPEHWLIDATRQLPLVAGENVVGRDPHAEIWLDSASVSRRHASLTVTSTSVVVRDLQSKNGTAVRGAPVVEPVAVSDGDQIRFGSVTLTLRTWAPDRSTKSGIDGQ
jgi:DNA-binding winged helix-turn-helix (wHTH) protein